MRNFKNNRSFYNKRTKSFLTGLLSKVFNFFKNYPEINVSLYDNRKNKFDNKNTALSMPKLEGIELRNYQKEAINLFIKSNRGIIAACTGSGKTEMAIAIFKALNVPTLWITHRKELMYQTADRFQKRFPEIKDKIGFIGDGEFTPNFLTFATVQTIFSTLKKSELKELNNYGFLIIDEAHRSKAKSFYKTAMLCNNAFYRLALTATPFKRDDDFEDMMLTGITGRISSKITLSDLIDKEYLAKPLFKYYDVNSPFISPTESWSETYKKGIVFNEERNNIIIESLKELIDLKKKTLIIIKSLDHADVLFDIAKEQNINIVKLTGKNSVTERQDALSRLTNGKLDSIIASEIFDEGIDIPKLDAVILAAGGKDPIAFYQRVGRVLRKKEGNNYCIIIDFFDKFNSKLFRHSQRRLEFVKQEKSFKIV